MQWPLLLCFLVAGLLAVVFLFKPIQKPGLENFWAVCALLSALQFAVWLGFRLRADWPFGTLLIRYQGEWVETGSTMTLRKLK